MPSKVIVVATSRQVQDNNHTMTGDTSGCKIVTTHEWKQRTFFVGGSIQRSSRNSEEVLKVCENLSGVRWWQAHYSLPSVYLKVAVREIEHIGSKNRCTLPPHRRLIGPHWQ